MCIPSCTKRVVKTSPATPGILDRTCVYEFFNSLNGMESQPSSELDTPTPSDKENTHTDHRNGRTYNPTKKCKVDSELTSISTRKWEEDKDAREEQMKREEERADRAERRQDALVDIMRDGAAALKRIAELQY